MIRMMPMKEYLTAAEIADLKLPGLPTTKRGVNKVADAEDWFARKNLAGSPLVRKREGRGGGWEYHYSLFPTLAQSKLIEVFRKENRPDPYQPREAIKDQLTRDELWAFYETLRDKKKLKAKHRLDILLSVLALEKGGTPKNVAVNFVARQEKISARSIYNWFNMVEGRSREDWLPALVPHNAGRMVEAECNPLAWEMIKADYLRAERPTFNSCYRRLEEAAAEQGWSIPSERTLKRRMDREIPAPVVKLARFGREAWKQSYPAQQRDRSVFHALEAVNADGHKWDVFVEWPDGHVGRPMMIAFQDLYSGKILSWRVDKTENKEAIRLAFGDMVEEFGIPEHCYLDNGRGFASKWLTGGTANRFRYKITDEDPTGIMTSLDIEVHWTLPYAGQSKPIERAFRDMCDDVAKDPRFHGGWAGNRVDNKPENYGKKTIPLKQFLGVVEEGIARHNARDGRRALTCRGRSFDQTFSESYLEAPIRKATDVQKRLWLLAAEGVKASSRDGTIRLMDNRYWSDFLHDHMGKKLIIRFDPQNLHKGLHVYRLDGEYLGFADVWDAAGFNDVEAAREHNAARKKRLKADKARLEAEAAMGIDGVIGYMAAPKQEEAAPLDSKVVKPVFGGSQARAKDADAMEILAANTPSASPLNDRQKAHLDAVKAELEGEGVNVFKLPESPRQRFKKARDLELMIASGQDVGQEEALWLGGYQQTSEYRAQQGMLKDFGEEYLS